MSAKFSFFFVPRTETGSRSTRTKKIKNENKNILYREKNTILQEIARDSDFLPALVANHSAQFGPSCPLTDNDMRRYYYSVGQSIIILIQTL